METIVNKELLQSIIEGINDLSTVKVGQEYNVFSSEGIFAGKIQSPISQDGIQVEFEKNVSAVSPTEPAAAASSATMGILYLVGLEIGRKWMWLTMANQSTYSWLNIGYTDIDLPIKDILNEYAKHDGFYEQMVVGEALTLAGQTQRTNAVMYRKSGGSEQVVTGAAEITNIKGNTVAWNQCSHVVNFTNTQTDTSNTLNLRIIGSTDPISQIETHVYVSETISSPIEKEYIFIADRPYLLMKHSGEVRDIFFLTNTSTVSGHKYFTKLDIKSVGFTTVSGTKIDSIILIDLTLIYGAGNEPTTVEEFEADYYKWFGKPLTYEEYDEGSLRSVQLNAIKTTGFNQWDEEWESGNINTQGQLVPQSNVFRAKNFIPVLAGKTYYFRITSGTQHVIQEYRTDKSHITYQSLGGDSRTFTVSDKTAFIKITVAGSTYNHDICINISDPSKNGTYEPYEEHIAPLPVTTLKGKLNGQGESVTIFPDGMNVLDSIYTISNKTYAVVGGAFVDLGSLTWIKRNGGDGVFQTAGVTNYLRSNKVAALCERYVYHGITSFGDQMFYLNNNVFALYWSDTQADKIVYIKDESYTDAATFKSAMNGVMLYYELETPLVYEVEGFTLPKTYLVDGGGTEEQVQKANVQGLAAILTCIYGVDAVGILDKLPRNYISEASMDNFLAKLNIATGGTWTKTFNENTGEWDFNYTPAANTNVNTNEESI